MHHLTAYVREAKCLRHLDISGMNIREEFVKMLVVVEEGIWPACCMNASKLNTVHLSDLGLTLKAKDFIINTLCVKNSDNNLCKLHSIRLRQDDLADLEDYIPRRNRQIHKLKIKEFNRNKQIRMPKSYRGAPLADWSLPKMCWFWQGRLMSRVWYRRKELMLRRKLIYQDWIGIAF